MPKKKEESNLEKIERELNEDKVSSPKKSTQKAQKESSFKETKQVQESKPEQPKKEIEEQGPLDINEAVQRLTQKDIDSISKKHTHLNFKKISKNVTYFAIAMTVLLFLLFQLNYVYTTKYPDPNTKVFLVNSCQFEFFECKDIKIFNDDTFYVQLSTSFDGDFGVHRAQVGDCVQNLTHEVSSDSNTTIYIECPYQNEMTLFYTRKSDLERKDNGKLLAAIDISKYVKR